MNLCDTTLLLTRPDPASQRLRGQLETALGAFADVVISPLIRIDFAAAPIPAGADVTYVFTSENGVAAAERQVSLRGRHGWCLGPRTADRAQGLGVAMRGTAPDVDALTTLILAAAPAGRLVHVTGRHRAGHLAERLTGAGLNAETVQAYDQVALPLSDAAQDLLKKQADVIAPVFSPRSARLLSTAANARLARLHVAAISPAAAAQWHKRGGERLSIARKPNAENVVAAVGRLFDADAAA